MRIKLTKNQFNTLIVEAAEPDGIFHKLANGNILKINTNGNDLLFQVFDQTSNALFLRNMNKGSTYVAFTYILPKSEPLDDKNIRIKRWKTEGGSQNNSENYSFNNISKISIYDAGSDTPKEELLIGSESGVSANVAEVINSIKDIVIKGKLFFFESNTGDLNVFRVLDINDAEIKFKLVGTNDAGSADLKGQTFTFKLDSASINADNGDPDTYNLILFDETGKKIQLSNIKDSGDYEEVKVKQNPIKPDKQLSKDELLNMIMSDPTLRDAFYKQPKLMGFINSGDPTGLATANRVLQKFNDDKGKDKKGGAFPKLKNNTSVEFSFTSDVVLSFKNRANNDSFNRNAKMVGKVEVNGGNTYIVSDRSGAKRWKIKILKEGEEETYSVNVHAYILNKERHVKEDEVNKLATIRITDYRQ